MAVTGAPELLIVMSGHATPEQVDEVVARLEEAGCAALVTPGREATVIGAIGERELLAALPLEGYAGVEQVQMRSARLLSETEQLIAKLKQEPVDRYVKEPEDGPPPTFANFRRRLLDLLPSLPEKPAACLSSVLDEPLKKVPLSYQENLSFNRILGEWASVVENERAALAADGAAALQSLRPLLLRMWDVRIAKARFYANEERQKKQRNFDAYKAEIRKLKPEALSQFPGELPQMGYSDMPLDLVGIDLGLLLGPAQSVLDKEREKFEATCGKIAREAWAVMCFLEEGPRLFQNVPATRSFPPDLNLLSNMNNTNQNPPPDPGAFMLSHRQSDNRRALEPGARGYSVVAQTPIESLRIGRMLLAKTLTTTILRNEDMQSRPQLQPAPDRAQHSQTMDTPTTPTTVCLTSEESDLLLSALQGSSSESTDRIVAALDATIESLGAQVGMLDEELSKLVWGIKSLQMDREELGL